MHYLRLTMMLLAGVGALNWGLTALDFNLVKMLLGSMPALEKATYILVGISGAYVLYECAMNCSNCKTKK